MRYLFLPPITNCTHPIPLTHRCLKQVSTLVAKPSKTAFQQDFYLSCYCYLLKVFVSHWTVCLIRVVEDDGNSSFRNPCLALLVNELLQVCCSDLCWRRRISARSRKGAIGSSRAEPTSPLVKQQYHGAPLGGGPHLGKVGYPQDKANGVQYVRLPTSIQSRDGIKVAIKVGYVDSCCIGLEAFDRYLFNVHDDKWHAFAQRLLVSYKMAAPFLSRVGC